MNQLHNREDASDLAQEAYLRYLQSANPETVKRRDSYIYRIALNLISEWRHRRDRSQCIEKELITLPMQEGGSAPADEPISDERLQRILSSIPSNYRRVLWMIKVEEKSHTEVARELGLSPKTVLVYLGRAVLAARQFQAKRS